MAALNSFKTFEYTNKTSYEWPLRPEVINEYCNWALTVRKLKFSTVEAYIYSLAIVHKIRGINDLGCHNYICKLMIRGAENLSVYAQKTKPSRNIMSLPLLKILGNEICNTEWQLDSKQCIWAACLTAFFGTCRMGELLSKNVATYDAKTTLLWGDLKFKDDAWLLHIKSPKSRVEGGEYVDIFAFPNHNCCPVKALLAWQKISPHSKHPDRPVFMLANGNLLTKANFNSSIKELLAKRLGKIAHNITGHSFRAGIPSILAKHPELASDAHIMGWGRWCSKAYLSYTRLKIDQKIKMFKKIVRGLNIDAK